MPTLLILLVTLPLAAAIVSFVTSYRVARALTVAGGIVCVALSIVLVPAATSGTVEIAGYLRLDAVGCVFLLATTALFALTSIYAVGYFGDRARAAAGSNVGADRTFRRYSARFYAGFNIFAWSMICAPLVNGLALLWIAVEITTVVSALLVALDNTDEAAEAAWKYVLIASSGLGIALLATIMLYYAGATALGSSYDLAFAPLLDAAKHLPSTPVQLAFALAVVGYGTKVGLFPVHTWLPDAHSEAPTPVSALLSGALLATSFYAIVRYFQVAVAALGPTFPQTMLLIFGVLSLLLAALYLFDQKNLKRMLAYSSIEHMGILAIGVSFGTPLAFAGVLLHVLGHALGKGAAFMGAGVLVHTYRTKELRRIRGGLGVLPWSAPLFLLAIFALCALPPFSIFRSEFQIVIGGLQGAKTASAAALVLLVTFAFFGLSMAVTRMLFRPARDGEPLPARGEPSVWMVVPVVVAMVALFWLGVHPPEALTALLNAGAQQLGVGR
jgi:hydrogenase-4 component F